MRSNKLGGLKAKLAKLKRELLTPTSGGGGAGVGFDVARTGIASVGFMYVLFFAQQLSTEDGSLRAAFEVQRLPFSR